MLHVVHSFSNWTRREEADFYRVVSTFGVERDCATGQFIWDNFRNFGRLERKLDDTLTEYFKAFYHMCMKVCDRFRNEEEGNFLLSLSDSFDALFCLHDVKQSRHYKLQNCDFKWGNEAGVTIYFSSIDIYIIKLIVHMKCLE